MTELITAITSVLTAMVGWVGDISTALIGNEVFQIILAVVLFLTLAAFLVNLVGKIKVRQRATA